MSDQQSSLARLGELLADRACGETLSSTELTELTQLRARHPEVDIDSYERAAAAVHLCLLRGPLRELPKRIRARLIRKAVELGFGAPRRGPRLRLLVASLGWAAAAVLLLVPRPSTSSVDRMQVLSAAADLRYFDWASTDYPAGQGVSGQVAWSDLQRGGFMRFEGLPQNDPTIEQYQLWVFDAERPAEHPVDGGVFDAVGESLVVPIDAKLPVSQPTLFAITLERPGGVVVSSRERLLLVANPLL